MRRFHAIFSSGLLAVIILLLLSQRFLTTVRANPATPVVLGSSSTDSSPSITATTILTQYLPIIIKSPYETPLPAPIPFTTTAPIDVQAVSDALHEQGLTLATNKVGFHTGIGGNIEGLDEWMTALDSAGVPIFLKSADNAEPLYNAQQLMAVSGVPHVLVYRRTGNQYDVPNYDLPPEQAAIEHWERHKAAWPPELDPDVVWIETLNEIDKNRSEWLAEFAYKTAQLALADGYKWAAFGWSSGEPEPEHWESPAMLNFLRLVSQHPDRLAIALHEYSYEVEDIGRWYPYLIGRFQTLFEVCDQHGIDRPTVLITEWGWEYQNVPEPDLAMEHIQWASWLYAAYPQVKGAAIWYLGGYFGDVHDQTQLLILPVQDYSLSHYFGYTSGQGAIEPALFPPPPPCCSP